MRFNCGKNPLLMQADKEALEAQIRTNDKGKKLFAEHVENAEALVVELEKMAGSAPSGFSARLKGVLQQYRSRQLNIIENVDRND